jgi:hypothetical protein
MALWFPASVAGTPRICSGGASCRKVAAEQRKSGRPLLLVDIDGVVSLWGFDPNRRPAGTFANVEGIVHFLSEEAARHLLTLRADFDLVWCTGWEEKANEHLPALLGLGPFPYLEFDGTPGTSTPGHWKLDAIDAHAPDRPLAWIDDAFNDACFAWAEARAAPTLLVETTPAEGLVAPHADRLGAWVRTLR